MGTHFYAIDWYNPFTGQQYPTIYEWSFFGDLNLPYPTLESNLDHSILYCKVYKWNQSFLPQQPTGYQKEDIYVQSGSFTNENEDLSVYDHNPQEERVFSVHPNPANKGCTIVLNGTCSQNAKIYINNSLGIVIKEINVESNDIWVDLSEYANGIYLIYLEDDCYRDFVKLIKT